MVIIAERCVFAQNTDVRELKYIILYIQNCPSHVFIARSAALCNTHPQCTPPGSRRRISCGRNHEWADISALMAVCNTQAEKSGAPERAALGCLGIILLLLLQAVQPVSYLR